MNEAEALLNSLTEVVPHHDHVIADTDSHFIIDPDTREITNSARRQYIMQGDHNSEIYTFDLPRYIDSHDMMLCNQVKVHYINIAEDKSEQNADVSDASPLQVKEDDENVVFCTWTIDRKATQLVGNLSFGVEFQCVTEEGEVVYEWNTDIYSDVEVKDSLDHGSQVVAEYSDILEQWRAQLFGAESNAIENINAAGEEQVAAVVSAGEEQKENINSAIETYMKENPIDACSEERVVEIVNESLGVIENGSY